MSGEPPMGWTRGSSAPLRGALLGLVLERPGGGGELTGRLRERFGDGWRVDRRDVYRLLDGLEREGLLECREQRSGERGQELERGGVHGHRAQLIFHPTELTSRALTEWMAGDCGWEPARHGIEAKLLLASERDAPALERSLRHYELECLALAASLPRAKEETSSRPSARENQGAPPLAADGRDAPPLGTDGRGALPPATDDSRSRHSPGRESAAALLRECARDGMLIRLQAEIDWARQTRKRIEEHTRRQRMRNDAQGRSA